MPLSTDVFSGLWIENWCMDGLPRQDSGLTWQVTLLLICFFFMQGVNLFLLQSSSPQKTLNTTPWIKLTLFSGNVLVELASLL